jgi:DNA-binding CsgD family transcriptional regulator
MDNVDALISSLYALATDSDWQSFRDRSVEHIGQALAARQVAWWSHAPGLSGELNQWPRGFVSHTSLDKLAKPKGELPEVVDTDGAGRAFIYHSPRTGLQHVLLAEFGGRGSCPKPEMLLRVGEHLCGAGRLSLQQFVRRDDWLHAMGRANRGAAALCDSRGVLYAVSERFRALMKDNGHDPDAQALSFPLPDAMHAEGGEFMQAALHLRVTRYGALYLLHARKPLPLDVLSPREQEIARALSNGKTLKSIARDYGIAVSTVANHTTRIYRKLSIYRREELIEVLHLKPSAVR